ncbi:hypothetical protein MYX06_00050 [Patescibacteria group bacterium AH-259-L05]|nr:hypothetical protein [Patescibacteria group bacterium AH-259-L05]
MKSETKICQNCENKFTIEPEDFDFYEKIKVPAPTFCPECRQQRRYAWRNERVMYRRDCDLCKKSTVTVYSPNKPYTVYCPPCWWSDKWDTQEYGREYDFNRPFFEQFKELQLKVPRIALLTKNSVNSEYTNHANNNRNCYLSVSVMDSENIMYSTNVWEASRDCVDCYHTEGHNELLYECIDAWNSYKCQYGYHLQNCNDCYYCFDCRGCSNCFLSYNLRNKQYHILNQPYSKEAYQKKIKQYQLGSYKVRERLYDQWLNIIQHKAVHRAALIERSTNCSGNIIYNSKNTHHAFDMADAEDSKYIIVGPDVKNSMDLYHIGFGCELLYEGQAQIHNYNTLFSVLCYHNADIQYCDNCHNSEKLFGCVGVKKGSYMILNKTYSKEEYKELKKRIIEHMRRTGEYGEFFPVKISLWGYNETQGQVYMPLKKAEVLARGWKWEDKMPGAFGKETIQPKDIPDNIKDVDDSILKHVLKCTATGQNYNIIPSELQFYQQNTIPLPRLHPEERYRRRLKLRPGRKLYKRKCAKTGKEILTAYAPERSEIVYSEEAYKETVL